MEESVYISPFISELMDYLDDCLLKLEEGRENQIYADPFYDSGLSDEKVDELIATIDEDCRAELGSFPSYHRNRQGCTAPPEYSRLSPTARRAMAEGCLLIIQRHTVILGDTEPIPPLPAEIYC
jgi:hypothetical protein